MAWTDPATDNQINALYWMIESKIGFIKAKERCKWLKENRPNRKEISEELGRVKELCVKYGAVKILWSGEIKKELLGSPIWEGYADGE